MIKLLLSALGLLLFSLSISAEKTIIKGISTSVEDGTEIFLFENIGKMGRLIMSDTIKNGKFKFDVEADSISNEVSLESSSSKIVSFRDLCMSPGQTVTVYVDSPIACTWKVESTIPEQKEKDKFMLNSEDLWKKVFMPQITLNQVLTDPSSSQQDKDAAMEKYKNEENKRDSLYEEIAFRDIQLLKTLPYSPIVLDYLVSMAEKLSYKSAHGDSIRSNLKEIFERMPDEGKLSESGKIAKAFLYPPAEIKVGDIFADADLYDVNGKIHHISDFQGKWKVLEFWSSGCYACIKAIDELKSFVGLYPDKVEVISISGDGDKFWKNASKEYDISWNNWNDGKEWAGILLKYGINGTPTFVIINPEGKVTEKYLGFSLGGLKNKFRKIIQPNPEMSIANEAGLKIVSFPDFDSDTTEGIIQIDKIELGKEATKLYFTDFNPIGIWIKISPDSYLETPDGKRYSVISADGITLGEEYYVGDNGEGKFSISFEPVPADTKIIDFQEGIGSNWRISGLRLIKLENE